MNIKYQKIIDLPHPISPLRKQMSLRDRAAQFLPFAALTGYEDQIKETARITNQRIELDEDAKRLLDIQLQFLSQLLHEQPLISVLHFVPDDKKEGGVYLETTGIIKKIDAATYRLILKEGQNIAIKDIVQLSSDVFCRMELME